MRQAPEFYDNGIPPAPPGLTWYKYLDSEACKPFVDSCNAPWVGRAALDRRCIGAHSPWCCMHGCEHGSAHVLRSFCMCWVAATCTAAVCSALLCDRQWTLTLTGANHAFPDQCLTQLLLTCLFVGQTCPRCRRRLAITHGCTTRISTYVHTPSPTWTMCVRLTCCSSCAALHAWMCWVTN